MLKRLRMPGFGKIQNARVWRGVGVSLWRLLGWWLAAAIGGAGAAPSFVATVDRDAVTMGESFTLSLKFEGGEPSA